MAQFDMRGQKVTGNQYIAGRDMNFGAVQSQADLVVELEKLKGKLAKAANEDILSDEEATDAEYQVTKALQQAQKPQADKKSILEHLGIVKTIIGHVVTAGELVVAVTDAITAVQRIF